jgi:hypothetical protein
MDKLTNNYYYFLFFVGLALCKIAYCRKCPSVHYVKHDIDESRSTLMKCLLPFFSKILQLCQIRIYSNPTAQQIYLTGEN